MDDSRETNTNGGGKKWNNLTPVDIAVGLVVVGLMLGVVLKWLQWTGG